MQFLQQPYKKLAHPDRSSSPDRLSTQSRVQKHLHTQTGQAALTDYGTSDETGNKAGVKSTWKRRSMTFSSTSYMHTYLVLPPASRKAPSALKAREVKHCPELELPRALRSDDKRPPAKSRRPSMLPCSQSQHCWFRKEDKQNKCSSLPKEWHSICGRPEKGFLLTRIRLFGCQSLCC